MTVDAQKLADAVATRRGFVAGAMAMGLSAAAATRLEALAQTPEASPVSGAVVDYLTLGQDQVEGTFPLTEEKVTFSVLVPSNNDVGSFEDNEFTRWLEEKTNIHLEWEVVPGDEADTGFNVRMASGDYPEILMSFDPDPAVQQLYGTEGIFVALNSYIDQFAVEWKRVVEQYPLSVNVITAADGNIYSLPYVNDCYHCAQDRKLWIYQPWLDAAGLAMPQTTDEFHAALTAFKQANPDAWPLSTCLNSWNSDLDLSLMNSFVFNPGEPYLFNQDGKVTAAYTQDGWKEGLRWLGQLYAEGLIDPEAFTQTPEQLQLKVNDTAGTQIGAAPGGSWGVFVQWDPNDPSQRWAEYKLMPALKGPGGVQISAYDPYLPYASGRFIITDKCKNPELAFKLADALYDLETTLRSVSGVPDQNWRWATEGEVGINGEQALWAAIPAPPATAPASNAWVQTGPSFRSSDFRFREVLIDESLRTTNLDVITEETLGPYRQPAEWVLPPMFFTEDQSALVAEAETVIVPFVKETFARIITSGANVDDEWEGFLGQLEDMGLTAYLEVYQTTLDAQSGA